MRRAGRPQLARQTDAYTLSVRRLYPEWRRHVEQHAQAHALALEAQLAAAQQRRQQAAEAFAAEQQAQQHLAATRAAVASAWAAAAPAAFRQEVENLRANFFPRTPFWYSGAAGRNGPRFCQAAQGGGCALLSAGYGMGV